MSPLLEATRQPATRRHDDAAASACNLFPLPLAPLEQLFLLDEFPSYPMQFFCRLRFNGLLRQDWLTDAARIAQARHPLLNAVVVVDDSKRPQWQPHAGPSLTIAWNNAEPAPSFPPASFLDIRTQPGLAIKAVVGANRSDLVLQIHHTACDGLGALDFATDLLTAYANLASGTQRYRCKSLDVSRLHCRNGLTLAGWRLFRWSMRRLPSARTLWRFFRRQPSTILPHRPFLDQPAPTPAFPETCVHHLTRAETAALASLAQGSEATLNALLVRDLFLTLANWRKQNQLPDDAWLRLMAPINLRTPADRRMPAANLSSMFFLDRCLSADMDAEALLSSVNDVMHDIKRNELGQAWLLALRALSWVPRAWANARRSRRRCPFSVLLTNLGPVLAGSPLPRDDRRLVVGDLILDDVEFIPLTRPLQCVGLAASTYAGRMTIGMRYDSRVMTTEQARQLMSLYVTQINGETAQARHLRAA